MHLHHPACAQNGENLPIGADPSGSFFASSWNKRLPIVRLWFLYKLHPSWVTRLVCAYTREKTTDLQPHPCVVYLLTLSLANYIFLRSSSGSAGRGSLHLFLFLLPPSWTTFVSPATSVSPLSLSIPAPAPVRVHAPAPGPCSRPCPCSRS